MNVNIYIKNLNIASKIKLQEWNYLNFVEVVENNYVFSVKQILCDNEILHANNWPDKYDKDKIYEVITYPSKIIKKPYVFMFMKTKKYYTHYFDEEMKFQEVASILEQIYNITIVKILYAGVKVDFKYTLKEIGAHNPPIIIFN